MYSLVSRVPIGMAELRRKFESHVHSQGLSAVEKCGDSVMNVCIKILHVSDGTQPLSFEIVLVRGPNIITYILVTSGDNVTHKPSYN